MRSGEFGGSPAQNPGHHTRSRFPHSRVLTTHVTRAAPYHSQLMDRLPRHVQLVIFDLDGVIYRGAEAVPGAVELVALLHERGAMVRFATNNSMVAREGYVARLGAMGIATERDEVVTSTSATIEHLKLSDEPIHRVMAVGADGMLAELADAGFDAVEAADAVPISYAGDALPTSFDAVIVGLDPAFDYRRLAAAMVAIRAGARFVATNVDRQYPTAVGFLPGAGSIVAAIAAAAGVEPEVIGKPQPAMFEAILAAAGVRPDEAVVIGDNPDADIVAANRAGVASILVLTGVADREAARGLTGQRRPDVTLDGPHQVAALLGDRLNR
jgi:4-nitrophenyl phosphatase